MELWLSITSIVTRVARSWWIKFQITHENMPDSFSEVQNKRIRPMAVGCELSEWAMAKMHCCYGNNYELFHVREFYNN